MNFIIQTLMRQLQSKNGKGFQELQNMMNMGQNPEPYVKQILGNMNPEQKQALFKQAQNYGVPNDVLSKIQNMK